MPITRSDLQHLCRLAHIDLAPDELEQLEGQISSVIDHVARLKAVDTTGVAPTSHAVPLDTVVRQDEVEPSWTPEQALSNAPRRTDDLFEVQAIFE